VNSLAFYYIAAVLLLFIVVSVGSKLSSSNGGETAQRLKSAMPMALQMTVCALGYGVFFFVVMLAIGIAVWLVLLGLVYLPADALNNVFGDSWSKNVVSNIMPYVSRSGYSPGLFRQPILDYATLSTLLFAPGAAILSTVNSHKRRQNKKGDTSSNFEFRKNSA
jgi:hypothetical protein